MSVNENTRHLVPYFLAGFSRDEAHLIAHRAQGVLMSRAFGKALSDSRERAMERAAEKARREAK